MQLKGLVRFFTIALLIVCLYQLAFTLVANRYENKASKYAIDRSADNDCAALFPNDLAAQQLCMEELKNEWKQNYLDSMDNEVVLNYLFKKYTLAECRSYQLNLGLDLQGGMSVVLQVSVEDVVRLMSDESKDPAFLNTMLRAKELEKNSQDNFVDLFGKAWEELNPGAQLSSIFSNTKNQNTITLGMSNDEVINIIKQQADDQINSTYIVLNARIDKFGVAQPNVNLQKSTGRIIIELPGVNNPKRVIKILETTANLEFWDCYENGEVGNYLDQANTILKLKISGLESDSLDTDSMSVNNEGDSMPKIDNPDLIEEPEIAEAEIDSPDSNLTDEDTNTIGSGIEDSIAEPNVEDFLKDYPLYAVLMPHLTTQGESQIYVPGPIIGYSLAKDTAAVNRYMKMPEIEKVLPRDLKLLWGSKPIPTNTPERKAAYESRIDGFEARLGITINNRMPIFELYAIKTLLNSPDPQLDGDAVTNSSVQTDQLGNVEISMEMDKIGSKVWERITEKASSQNPKRSIAIVLDNVVYSAPRVDDKISGGRSSISGDFSYEEAKDLANILNTGKLPAKAKILEIQTVGPTLGKSSIQTGLIALIISLIAVIILMISYYGQGGVNSILVLFINIFFIFGALASLGASLTLPGLAGIILTIGMAVDANVIIFERIREEIAKGKGMKLAVVEGYKHSYSSIIDGNLTTLLVGFILLFFGLGPIKGFATVLCIGILTTMFTAVLVSRWFIEGPLKKDKNITFGNKFSMGLFKKTHFDFMKFRFKAYGISAVIIIIGLVSFFTRGFELGVDFKGGRMYEISFDQSIETEKIAESLLKITGSNATVKTIGLGSSNKVKIITPYLINEEGEKVDSLVERKVYDAIAGFYSEKPDFDQFIGTDRYVSSYTKVLPTISDDIQKSAVWSIILGLLGIGLYILFRFRRWQFSLGAILSLAHDVLITLTFFTLLRGIVPWSLEFDQTIIAAVLTLIGYSINDTVIVFDRIRENIGLYPNKREEETINMSLNQTLSRTIMTSVTVFLVVFILFIFGADSIRGFAFFMTIGVITGTYSSIFIATPATIDFKSKKQKTAELAKAATMVATA